MGWFPDRDPVQEAREADRGRERAETEIECVRKELVTVKRALAKAVAERDALRLRLDNALDRVELVRGASRMQHDYDSCMYATCPMCVERFGG